VVAVLDGIPADSKDRQGHRGWQISLLQQTMQEANQLARIRSGPAPLPQLADVFVTVFTPYADHQLALAELIGKDQDGSRLGEAMQGAQQISQRWQRVNQLIYPLASARDEMQQSAEALEKLPADERATLQQTLTAADTTMIERIKALSTVLAGKDELALIQAIAAANLAVVEWQRAHERVHHQAELSGRIREAGLSDNAKVRERLQAVMAAFDQTTAAQLDAAKVRAHIELLEYKAQGLDDRANRLEQAQSEADQALEMLLNGESVPSEAEQNADRIPLDPKF
jgi:hypothetical protein